jgi:hypothetical protein
MLPGSRQSTGAPFSFCFFFSALTTEKTSTEAMTISRLAINASTRFFLKDCIEFLNSGERKQASSAGAAARGGSVGAEE